MAATKGTKKVLDVTASVVKPVYTIKAGEIGYDIEQCFRCYWLSTVKNISKPKGAFFSTTASETEKHQRSLLESCEKLSSLCSDFPKGKIILANKRPTSVNIGVMTGEVVFTGQFNYLAQLEEGGVAIIKFATSDPKDLDKIKLQLHCQMFAVEYNANMTEGPFHVKQLGVLVFDPNAFDQGKPFYRWHEITIDRQWFMGYIVQLVDKLNHGEPEYTVDAKGKISCPSCQRDKDMKEYYSHQV